MGQRALPLLKAHELKGKRSQMKDPDDSTSSGSSTGATASSSSSSSEEHNDGSSQIPSHLNAECRDTCGDHLGRSRSRSRIRLSIEKMQAQRREVTEHAKDAIQCDL